MPDPYCRAEYLRILLQYRTIPQTTEDLTDVYGIIIPIWGTPDRATLGTHAWVPLVY